MANILADRLRAAMDSRGVSAKRLAEKTGMSQSNVSRYMTGSVAPGNLETLANMAKALDVSTDYLLGLTSVPTPAPEGADVVGGFNEEYSYLYGDRNFWEYCRLYAGAPEAVRPYLTEVVKGYETALKILGPDGKTFVPRTD